MTRFCLWFLLLCLLFSTGSALAAPVQPLDEDGVLPFPQDAPLMRLVFFRLDTQDCILIQCGGETMLVDCGMRSAGNKVANRLLEMGIDHIDYAVNTHPHDDHIDGFVPLFDRISVGQFLVCFPLDFNVNMVTAVAAARAKGIPVVSCTGEDDLSFGGNRIRLYQNLDYPHTNYRSLVMHVSFGDCAALLLADVGRPVQKQLAALGDEPPLVK